MVFCYEFYDNKKYKYFDDFYYLFRNFIYNGIMKNKIYVYLLFLCL